MASDLGMRPKHLLNLPDEEREFLFAARSEQNRRKNNQDGSPNQNP